MPEYETVERCACHRRGRCGVAAAIEASAAGVSVGIVCKSLSGKAHTVMAEECIAPRWPTSMSATIGKFTSDTMRGGQYVNNWRWRNSTPE